MVYNIILYLIGTLKKEKRDSRNTQGILDKFTEKKRKGREGMKVIHRETFVICSEAIDSGSNTTCVCVCVCVREREREREKP